METVGLGLYLHMAPPPYCYRCPFGLTYPLRALASVKNLETTILGERPETVAEVIVEPIISGVGVAVPPTQSAYKSLINRSSQCSIPGPVQQYPKTTLAADHPSSGKG